MQESPQNSRRQEGYKRHAPDGQSEDFIATL